MIFFVYRLTRLRRFFLFISASLMHVPLLFAQAEQTNTPVQATFPAYQVETIATALHFPWSLAFLPDGKLLVTERTGQLRMVDNGELSAPIAGLPEDIYVKSQGGLLDVILHPNYQQNGWLYLSYASGTDEHNALTLMRAKLDGLSLVEQQVLFRVSPDKDTPVHFAGRMTFLPDNTLLLTSGDGFDYREKAQLKNSLLGKIVRLMDDGSVPLDNPFVAANEVLADADYDPVLSPYIYSLGHRNPQGIAYDVTRKVVFAHEHGPAGGDEINIIESGHNYGWPVITNGLDYSGARISPFTTYANMQQPWLDWTPSIAPSGMAIYQGTMFADLQGDILVTSLKFKQVYWLHMAGMEIVQQSTLFSEIGQRLRDIRVHPDGSIYLLTDSNEGQILRISAQTP